LFFEGSWKHAVHPQPSKKDGLTHSPQPSKQKRVVIHPAILQKQKKNLFPPCKPSKAPKDDVFSQSPYSLRTFKKKGLVLTPNH